MAGPSAKSPSWDKTRMLKVAFWRRMRVAVVFLTLLQAFGRTPVAVASEAKCAPTIQYAVANDKMLDFLHRTNADLYPLYSSGGATGYLGQVQNEVEKLLHGGNANNYPQHLKERANLWVHDTRSTWLQKVRTDQYLKLSVCLGNDPSLQCSWLTPLVCSTVTPDFAGGVTIPFGAQKLPISCEGIFQLVKFTNPNSEPKVWEVDKLFLRQNQGFAPKPISGNGSTNNGFYLENMADSSLVAGEWVLDVETASKDRQNWLRVANQAMSTCPKQYPRMNVPKFGAEFRMGGMGCTALSLANSIANYGTLVVSMAAQVDDVSRSQLPCQNIQAVLTYSNLLTEYGPTLFLRFNGIAGWYLMLSQLSSSVQTTQPTGQSVLPGTDAFNVRKAFEASTLCILDCYNAAASKTEASIQPCLDACTPGGSLSKKYGTTIAIPLVISMYGQPPVGYFYPVDTVLRKYPANICHANNSVTVPGGPQPNDAGWWYTSTSTKTPVAEYCWKDGSVARLPGGKFASIGSGMISKLLGQNTSDVGIDLPTPQVKDGALVTAWLQLLQTIVLATATTLFGLWITKSAGTVDSAASFFRKCKISCEPCLKFVITTAVLLVIGAYNTAALVLLIRSIRQANIVSTISTVAVNQTTSVAEMYVVELLTITETSQRAWPGLVMLPIYLAVLVVVLGQALWSIFTTVWTDRTRFMTTMEYQPLTEMHRRKCTVDTPAEESSDGTPTDEKDQQDDFSVYTDGEGDVKTPPSNPNAPGDPYP